MADWNDLRVLLAVHRGRTLAAAGRMLRVDATTVGRRLAALEQALGVRLVVRAEEGLVLTAEGLEAVAVADRAEELLQGLERRIGGADERVAGVVRLTAGDGLMASVLVPALPRLRAAHPQLHLELLATPRSLDLGRREADLAVRLYRPREPWLVARRLKALRYGLWASRAYLERAGSPRTLEELARHELLTFDSSLEETPEMRWLRQHVPEPRLVVRANTTPVLVAACRAGLGICPMSNAFAVHEPELVQVLPDVQLPSRETWAAFHSDLRGSARVKAVLQWLTEVLAER